MGFDAIGRNFDRPGQGLNRAGLVAKRNTHHAQAHLDFEIVRILGRELFEMALTGGPVAGAEGGPGEVTLAPGPAGDVVHYPLRSNELYMSRGAFVAHGEGVEVDGRWGGAKGFFSGTGLLLLKARGEGDLWFNAYGALLEMDVSGEFYVDTGYVVAFEDTLDYQVTTLPGLGRRELRLARGLQPALGEGLGRQDRQPVLGLAQVACVCMSVTLSVMPHTCHQSEISIGLWLFQ